MKRNIKITGFLLLCILSILLCMSGSIACSAEQSSSSYYILRSVMSGGGTGAGSTGYKLRHTIGQPTPAGTSSSSNNANFAGFWFLLEGFQDTDGDDVPDDYDDFPDNPYEWLDTDGDGIGNNMDTDDDNDGMPDVWEITYGLDPLIDDSGDDYDRDGFSNLKEYLRGTIPNDLFSHPPRDLTWLPLLLGD